MALLLSARAGEKVKHKESGVEIFLPDGMVLKTATPERVVLSGEAAELFSVVVIVEVQRIEGDEDLDDLFEDLGGDLHGPFKIKGWVCADKVERRPGKNQKGEVAVGRCIAKQDNRHIVSATFRGTPEHFQTFGGLDEVQKVAASFKVKKSR